MKTLTFLIMITFTIFVSACKKSDNKETTLPESVNFELVDKTGKSLISSMSDSVKISYTQDGIFKYHSLVVQKLSVSDTDPTPVKKYNGLVINDAKFMSRLSSLTENPIRDFDIYLNGINMGSIHLDYWAYQDAYPKISSEYLTFNNVPTIDDRNNGVYTTDASGYFATGSNINLLVVQ